jgi:hypothetical protein
MFIENSERVKYLRYYYDSDYKSIRIKSDIWDFSKSSIPNITGLLIPKYCYAAMWFSNAILKNLSLLPEGCANYNSLLDVISKCPEIKRNRIKLVFERK